jgi:DNA-binding response OmpR family regulator
MSAAMLIAFGYRVDEAADGAAAWQALKLNSDKYDLLITDNHMPAVSGIELVKKLRSVRIALPVILASGTIPEKLNRHSSLQLAAVLPKPFTAEELLGTVKNVLTATGPSPNTLSAPPSRQQDST